MVTLRQALGRRLEKTYRSLVKGFGKTGSRVAPGPGATAERRTAASYSQKLCRFCKNTRAEYRALIEPLIDRVRHEAQGAPVLLAVHDWSTLSYGTHTNKADRLALTHETDIGYDLATVLMVRADNGSPLAPVSVSLRTAQGVLSTDPDPVADVPHIDQIHSRMKRVAALDLGPLVVHVSDREADSVGHWRDGARDGHAALVRGDDRVVRHGGRERKLTEIAEELRAGLTDAGPALYHGRPAKRFVGEAAVVLERPARRREGGVQREIPGEPLALRLVVVELRDGAGRTLSRWLLLTNVPARVAGAATVALWYYWRWRIESLHKLLKSAGWCLEQWLQQTGARVLRKLLVALAAGVEIWALERRTDAASESFKQLLMNLSGRQTKARQPTTTSALLAGLWVLQQAATWLSRDSPDNPSALLAQHVPLFVTYDKQAT